MVTGESGSRSLNPFWLMAALFVTVALFFAGLKGLQALPGIAARKLGVAGRPAGEAWLQWALLNGGFVLIITGMVGIDSWTAAVRAARGLLFNWWAPGGRIGYLEAHVHANVWGFSALIVAGMLFEFFPGLTGGPMARPGWIRPIYGLLNLGALGLVVGPLVNLHAMTIGGLLLYFAGTAMLITNLVLTLIARRTASPASCAPGVLRAMVSSFRPPPPGRMAAGSRWWRSTWAWPWSGRRLW